ncbi:MAG: ferritin-like domain-containing protein [Myxococcota bacterium]
MENRKAIIDALNEAVKIENTLMLQCQHQSLTIRGLWRVQFEGFFQGLSDEARDHSRKFGLKIAGLGGNPTVAVSEIIEARDVFEMLELDLELERKALAAYTRALKLADENVALRNMLEDHIEAETQHIEELELVAQRADEAKVRRIG